MTSPAARAAAVAPPAAFAQLFRALAPDLPGGAALRDLREAGFARFARDGLPTDRAEDWRYTDLAAGWSS
jgi:hypothetical protein